MYHKIENDTTKQAFQLHFASWAQLSHYTTSSNLVAVAQLLPPPLSPQPVNPDPLPNSSLLIPLLLMLATNPFWTPNLYYKNP